MQKIEFFDRHSASELQGLLSVELDTMRSFVFRCGVRGGVQQLKGVHVLPAAGAAQRGGRVLDTMCSFVFRCGPSALVALLV